jgi:tetratricopeptide (TPR) repeat protein
MRNSSHLLALLLTLTLSLGVWLQPQVDAWSARRSGSANLFALLLGDGRRVFASHFYRKADVYFHSGYYPSMFNERRLHEKPAIAGTDSDGARASHLHDTSDDILGQPSDWVERFGRNFIVAEHTHLDSGREREMLPWLRLSAALDPNQPETYTVAAHWLRTRLDQVDEAERFLREGWRHNPRDPAILFELGHLFYYSRTDIGRARNVWELALRFWREQEALKPEPDLFLLEQILANLAQLERAADNRDRALAHLEALKPLSPVPGEIQKQIDELRRQERD